MRLLFISTPVGAFGSGVGGGVELTVENVAKELMLRSHTVHLAACVGSQSQAIPLITIPGEVHSFAQNQTRTDPVSFPNNSVLANLWSYAREMQDSYDLIVNFAYDWLPFYLTPFFDTPIAHFVSMGSLLDSIDRAIAQVVQQYPDRIGVYTQTQADTFDRPFPMGSQFRLLGSGIDLDLYEFQPTSAARLAWVARISPEKGLEDAAAVSEATGLEIDVLGKMQDREYWEQVQQDFPKAKLNYLGFHPTEKLQELMGACQALLMTPKWVEAFGNVAIEALACGVPIVSYARGGPVEIIKHGKTGYLVEPDNVRALCDAVTAVPRINRIVCRREAEAEYSLTALGDRFEQWFIDILA
ncbi:glycosyltransferase [Tumidithrix elongata RA019]|uniref:Glycosyltransferase n=1 Tax=Tumidithrix elongata BACA0141 TaxID=2716417 RepID=A0AAW9Q6G4_9CYAN|nr:glycosyltransferase [Tumidithrix elongata RA019]